MAEIKSFPNNQDEYIGAEDVMRWLHGRTSGVFGAEGNASVCPNLDSMSVIVTDGKGWLSNSNGDGIVWWIDNTEKTNLELELSVDMADAYLPRIDRVVVSWQTTTYVDRPSVMILKGTPASNPVPPTLTNDKRVRQISLARIYIPAGATSINASMITDERLDPSVCGIVTESVTVDTSGIQRKVDFLIDDTLHRLDDMRTDAENTTTEFIAEQTQKWDAFFDHVQEDTIVPVPGASDKGKAIIVNEDGTGYILGDAQGDIPITSDVPENSDIWIDPNEPSGTVELGFDSGELPAGTQQYKTPVSGSKFVTVTIGNEQGNTHTAIVDCTVIGQGNEYNLPDGFGGCLFASTNADGTVTFALEDGAADHVYIIRVCGYGYVGGGNGGGTDDAVLYTPQTLTEEQKAQARENIGADVSPFCYRYSRAEKTYNISADDGKSSVKLYLFPANCGYVAIVAGKGAMKNHAVTLNDVKGIIADAREYAEHIKKINKVYIERGVTSIGDYFMYRAFYLKDVIFEDSSQIAYLGKYCFACTQISGEFKFCNLENNTVIDHSFFCCPNLKGITLGVSATEDKNLEVSEQVFFGCLNLEYFKIDDLLNTILVLGGGSFEYCTSLKQVEIQPEKTVIKGFNFLLTPYRNIRLQHRNASTNTMANTPFETRGNIPWKNKADVISTWDIWTYCIIYDEPPSWEMPYYNDYLACLAVAKEYDGKRHELMIAGTDWQKRDEFLAYEYPWTADMDCKGVFWGKSDDLPAFRIPYYGSCWLFAYMHVWNVTHQYQQYVSIEDFVAKLQETKITVDSDLATAFENWSFLDDVMAATDDNDNKVYANGYFSEGKEIYVTDLPTDLNPNDSVTVNGVIGEASWGVRKVLKWTGERLTATTDRTWADIKKATIDSIFAGKPVIIECVRYGGEGSTKDNIGGVHAVAAIGYDAKTDKLKIIDSSWDMPSDAMPFEYWTGFEDLLEPSEESAVWIFSAFDSGALLTPA